jgi:quinol monooxygenase YgiN
MADAQQATISAGTDGVTLLTVFTCAAELQGDLVAALARATEEVLARQPGFISATIHASLDRTRVVNYAQWASREAYEAVDWLPEAQERMAQIMAIAESADPRMLTVRSVHRA